MAVAQRIYARALFEAAREEGKLERVASELEALASALDAVPALERFLRNPEVDPAEKAAVLEEIASDADALTRNFLRLVVEKGRAGELREMHAELEALVARAENRLTVELETAYELSDEEARRIVETIERASGRTVEATRSVDPSLIGGIVLRIGSFRADGSVRGRLERLRHELTTQTA
ncbi:MAG: ATP synthase F1 subunit delta [Thermoleophilia bacterium]|nr:ATP synthase F1 subunit delta [Gaiellaceae bacterium]MDW8338335.1 ATP synthase F1 subunit delta [Thermoleophilia bacterium]